MLVHISFHFAGGDFLALSVWGACLSESANYLFLLCVRDPCGMAVMRVSKAPGGRGRGRIVSEAQSCVLTNKTTTKP